LFNSAKLVFFSTFIEKKTSIDEDEYNEGEEKTEEEKELEKLEKGEPEMIKVCNTIMGQLDEFKKVIPVITILCNPGIRDRHWEKMSEIATRNLKPDAGTTLRKVLKMGIDEFMPQFDVVSASASKEFSLEKAMKKMMSDWEPMVFVTAKYKDTGKLNCFDKMFKKILIFESRQYFHVYRYVLIFFMFV
jgi:dynein heavy chain